MTKRFYAAPELANTVWIFFICGIGYIFVAWDAGTLGGFKVQLILLTFFVLTGLFWVGAKYGTYIEVDEEKNIFHSSRSFITKKISIGDIKSISIEETFGGTIIVPIISYENQNGKLKKIRLISKQVFKKGEFEEFIKFIHEVNPQIEIMPSLLK